MKDNDILLYGGLAVAAYLIFMKKPVTTVPGQVQMVTPVAASNLPATGTSNLLSTITTGLSNIVKNIGPAAFTPGQLISEPIAPVIDTDLPQLTQTLPVQRPDTGALTNPVYAQSEIAPTGYEDNIPGYYNNSTMGGINGFLAEELAG